MKIAVLGKGYIHSASICYLSNLGYDLNYVNNFDAVRKLKPDLLISLSYSHHFPKDILELPKHGCINVHTSLLPRYRGRHPISWAQKAKEREIGITVLYMTEKIDAGDIILQDSIVVDNESDYLAVTVLLMLKGVEMLDAAIRQIKYECVYRRKQLEELATYYPPFKDVSDQGSFRDNG